MTRPKLLLADDSVTIRKVVELTFADEGIDVSTVADADAAMQKFVEIQPDIVLVDVGLSGTNGYHICEMIKQDEATKHIPVLLLVGSFEPFDQDAAENACADGFLTKPFHSIRDLVTRVFDLLGREPEVGTVPPETADIDNLYMSSFAETAEIEEFDTVDDLLGDSGMDDEMIEASYPARSAADASVDLKKADDNGETVKDFDWSPESLINETEPVQIAYAGFEPQFVFEESGEQEADAEIPAAANDGNTEEPSPEFISLVAQRVIEKLSDRVIREIARETVPEIAEKLIREALEDDKNSSQ